MEGSNKSLGERASEESPSGPATLGALSPLPEAVLAHACSFLSGRDLARLGGACAALHESPVSLWPSLVVCPRTGLLEPEGEDEEGERLRFKAMRMLARRAAGALKKLWMKDERGMEAFCSAVQMEGQPLRMLTYLQVYFSGCGISTGELKGTVLPEGVDVRLQVVVAELLASGHLPVLRELRVGAEGLKTMLPVWRALGEGACPKLEKIRLGSCSPQQLLELAEAWRVRPEGCAELKGVVLEMYDEFLLDPEPEGAFEALSAFLSRLSHRSLEEVFLAGLPPDMLQTAVIPLLNSGCLALKTLRLSFDVPAGRGLPSADGLLHTLARGALPSLTSLSLDEGTCSDEAWRALGEAMGPEGTCLRRIKTLDFSIGFCRPRQVEILSHAIGTGHGCPELEEISLWTREREEGELCGAALARAFQPPRGLPRIKELSLTGYNLTDLDQLVEALQHRPHAVQPLETISMIHCKLGQAMTAGRSLAGLKQLFLNWSVDDARDWPMQLVEALAGGAGQQLEEIECSVKALSVDAANRVLQAIAIGGACPKLRSLTLHHDQISSHEVVEGGWLDADALGAVLAGRAACSATLRKLSLLPLGLSNDGMRVLAACLREPQAIQLRVVGLCAGEPNACAVVMEVMAELLAHPRSRLSRPSIWLAGCPQDEVMSLVAQVIHFISDGSLPATCSVPCDMTFHAAHKNNVSKKAIKRALEQWATRQWLASWQ